MRSLTWRKLRKISKASEQGIGKKDADFLFFWQMLEKDAGYT
jgi:hypothetical protein